jgi:hypothetical protein
LQKALCAEAGDTEPIAAANRTAPANARDMAKLTNSLRIELTPTGRIRQAFFLPKAGAKGCHLIATVEPELRAGSCVHSG